MRIYPFGPHTIRMGYLRVKMLQELQEIFILSMSTPWREPEEHTLAILIPFCST